MKSKYQTFPSQRGFSPPNLGLLILCPTTDLEESVSLLSYTQRKQCLYGVHYALSCGFCGAFAAMWRYKAHKLATYGQLLMKGGVPISFERQTIHRKVKVKDTGFPDWWGDPVIHNSHREYIETEDLDCLVFPKRLHIKEKKW